MTILAAVAMAIPLFAVASPSLADDSSQRIWSQLEDAGARESISVPFEQILTLGNDLGSGQTASLAAGLRTSEVRSLDRTCERILRGGYAVNTVLFCNLFQADIDGYDDDSRDRRD